MKLLSFVVLASLVASCNPVKTDEPLFESAPGSPIAVKGGPGNVVLGDVNKDGKPDLVVANGRDRTIIVLLGQGDGRFRVEPGKAIKVPDPPSDMVLRDLNGDGNLDLAITSHDSYGVMLLTGDGAGGFAIAANSPIVMHDGQHPHTHGLDVGDLNGDGKIDMVTVNSEPGNSVSVAFGDGRGGFTRAPGSPFAVGPSPYPGVVGDINGDGKLDIVSTTIDRGKTREPVSKELTLLAGDGKGGFRRGQVSLKTAHPWFVVVSDVNGDKKPDLLVTHAEASELSVLLGDGRGGFTEPKGSPFDLGHAAWQIAAVDVNRDNKVDVVAAAGDGLRVMLGDGHGSFQPAPGSPYPAGKGAWRLAAGDLNGDGKIDVATSNLESDSVAVLLGR